MTGNFQFFAGTANPQLAQAVAEELAINSSNCEVKGFPDGEIAVRL